MRVFYEITGVRYSFFCLHGNHHAFFFKKIIQAVNPMGNEVFNKRSINISYPFGTGRALVK